MNRDEYLNNKGVLEFITWVGNYLDNSSNHELHSWIAQSSKAAPKKGMKWSCSSLFNAYEKYYWKSKDPNTGKVISRFDDTENCLKRLGQELNKAIAESNGEACLSACNKILDWGGVLHRSVATVIRTIPEKALPYYLETIKNHLELIVNGEKNNFSFNYEGENYKLEIDSGTTKIYSLLNDEWIIYDGRVGAALGLLVAKWAAVEKKDVPVELRFSWGHEKRRNPNPKNMNIFPPLDNSGNRLIHNLHGSWLCHEIINDHTSSKFSYLSKERQLRSLEAALFMIGYSVKAEEKNNAVISKKESKDVDMKFVDRIKQKFEGKSSAVIKKQGGTFVAEVTSEGILAPIALKGNPLLTWDVFNAVEELLINSDSHTVMLGDCMGPKLGSRELPMDSLEGHVASKVYGQESGDSVFRRSSVIANILVWAEICERPRGKLKLKV